MNPQIPIYRAKKIGSDEYVKGYLYDKNTIITKDYQYPQGLPSEVIEVFNTIDPTTLAIHFSSMVDSQGNKIFASLNKDGKGGDCTFMENKYYETFMWDTLNACVVLKSKHYECKCFRNGNRNETTFNTYTIIGIQK